VLNEILSNIILRGREFLYLSRSDLERLNVSFDDVINWVESVLKIKDECVLPSKVGVYTRPKSFLHAMPAWVPPMNAVGVKIISGYAWNKQKYGLPYIMGLMILNDEDSGAPYAVMDCSWPTEMRTAAVSAVSAKYLAREDSEVLGVIGLGTQAKRHVQALARVLPIKEVKGYDISENAAKAFKSWVEGNVGVKVEIVSHSKNAVIGCDVVVSAIPISDKPTHIVKPEWISKGMTLIPIDFDASMDGKVASKADKFYTDDLKQYAYYWSDETPFFKGYPSPNEVFGEVAEVVRGEKSGRETAEEIIMVNNLGIAIVDVAVAINLFYRAIERGIGEKISL